MPAAVVPGWQLADDVAAFKLASGDRVRLSVITTAAQALDAWDKFRAATSVIEKRSADCQRWVVMQDVDVGNAQVRSALLCKEDGHWTATPFSFVNGHAIVSPEKVVDSKVAEAVATAFSGSQQIDVSRYTVLDATTLFVSASGGLPSHSAAYAVPDSSERAPGPQISGFVLASNFLYSLEDSSE